jgi:hypothetical protein
MKVPSLQAHALSHGHDHTVHAAYTSDPVSPTRIHPFIYSSPRKKQMWDTLDAQTKAGIMGQLAGHGIVWGKQVLGGQPISSILNSSTLMWAGINIASEYLTTYASQTAGTALGGVIAPAAVQVAALNMSPEGQQAITRITSGDVMAILDSPFLAGTVGSIIAKSYA